MEGCYSCGGTYTPLVTGNNGVTQILSHADCEGITIDLLNMFLKIAVCTITNNTFLQAGSNEAEVNSTITLLNSWIAAKQADPATCQYQEKLPLIQAVINKLVAFGQC